MLAGLTGRSLAICQGIGAQHTFVLGVLAGDLAVGVGLELWTCPGAVEVGLDDHVGGRSVEGAVERWLLASSICRSRGVETVLEEGARHGC